ncbi:hypothetical protein RJ639_001891 [Escallonia herrerae]|uniref:Lipoxygenase n=1 Tax=Escallonia herrerae TaxID=1293975 RepID=A0AA88X9W5_9ASTE|nr:hypothetical protein RJ639_001891 [Escallonia herrerae]
MAKPRAAQNPHVASYLPFQTPGGVKKLREKELTVLRGDGQGERKTPERIYDYDVYNDLGDPDSSSELARPILGGKDYPYPRRCRTGRPKSKKGDKFSWFRDEEFSRQTLASLNPYSIELVTALEQKKLFMLDYHDLQALEQNKLFMLDYHDLLLPYVNKVREIKGTILYGIEDIVLPNPDCCKIRLRTHCATEPYIIATNRQLSTMHPIYRLLHPHWRYTMEINALAREALINANGIIESSFTPGKYCMELSSAAYD